MALACDSPSLLTAANQIDCCIPDGIKDAVLIYLLAVKVGFSTNPKDLITAATKIDCCVPKGMRDAVIANLLCTAAGG